MAMVRSEKDPSTVCSEVAPKRIHSSPKPLLIPLLIIASLYQSELRNRCKRFWKPGFTSWCLNQGSGPRPRGVVLATRSDIAHGRTLIATSRPSRYPAPIHFAHPAGAQGRLDFVGTKFGARGQGDA